MLFGLESWWWPSLLPGYWWVSALASANGSVSTATGAPDAAAGAATHTTSFDQIAAMTEKLSARLKEQPQDAEGWAMLARSYSVLGRHPEALVAYEKALALRKDDAMLVADYADSLAVKNGGQLDGEPMKQVERALKLEPRNLKALFLAGTHAFNRKDYKLAVKHWQTAVQAGPAEDPFVKQIEPGLAEARQLAGLPPLPVLREPMKTRQRRCHCHGAVSLSRLPNKYKRMTPFLFLRPGRWLCWRFYQAVKDLPLQFDGRQHGHVTCEYAFGRETSCCECGNAMPQPGTWGIHGSTVGTSDSPSTLRMLSSLDPYAMNYLYLYVAVVAMVVYLCMRRQQRIHTDAENPVWQSAG
jgi:cytochrome c-type biogenesis protein CcmH